MAMIQEVKVRWTITSEGLLVCIGEALDGTGAVLATDRVGVDNETLRDANARLGDRPISPTAAGEGLFMAMEDVVRAGARQRAIDSGHTEALGLP